MTLFASHLSIRIAKDEADGGEEVGLSGSIATDDDVTFRRERLDDCLLLVTVRMSVYLT